MQRHGFLIAEGLVGIGVLAVVAGVLFIGIVGQSAASHKLADARAATRAAEAVLAGLECQKPIHPSDAQIEIHPLPDSSSVKRFHWVEIKATVGDQSRYLIGLAPDNRATTIPATGAIERSTP